MYKYIQLVSVFDILGDFILKLVRIKALFIHVIPKPIFFNTVNWYFGFYTCNTKIKPNFFGIFGISIYDTKINFFF